MAMLSAKQQKFVDAYCGNATEAALKAGYSKNTAGVIGHENLKKPYILEAIRNRDEKPKEFRIATRQERQDFWTRVMCGQEKDIAYEKGVKIDIDVKMSDRLKAAELLGRSEADFTDNVKADVKTTNMDLSDAELDTLIAEKERILGKNEKEPSDG